ncbi:MAG TPA: PA0069 family radical SAM protein [Burkholderiaceae bacterium]|nr:PA0069 family radical SAM protein [Burkholderiaceae bacterium]
MQPVRFVHKGRGAVSNPAGRFERDAREPVDDGWARDEDDAAEAAPDTVVLPDAARSIIARNTSPDIGFDASINPYRGCEHGCVYCYARPGHAFLGLSPGLDFETRLFAKLQAPVLLEAELARPGYRCEPIAIGTVTDAWQPVERRLRLTRGCLEVFARTGHPVSLITKSSLVERDLDLLGPMGRDGLASAMVTVTTLDPTLSRVLEPRAPAPWRRLRTIRALADAGVDVGVSLAPIVPFVNEPEIEAILDAAHEAGARFANYVVLRLPHELVEVFDGWLREHLPDRADRVMARLRDLRGGRDNDPRFGWRMKGQGPWAELIRARFDARLRRWGSGRVRPTLRTDRFVAPTRVRAGSAVPGPDRAGPRQGSLF